MVEGCVLWLIAIEDRTWKSRGKKVRNVSSPFLKKKKYLNALNVSHQQTALAKRRPCVNARGNQPMEFLPSTASHKQYHYVLILRSKGNLKAIAFSFFFPY